jgi:hypothetical protein
MMRGQNQHVSESEIDNFIRTTDRNNDGKIQKHEIA